MATAFIVLWMACGVLAYGLTLGAFQGEFPQFGYKERLADVTLAAMGGLTGVFGLVVIALFSYAKRGRLEFRFRPISEYDSWQAYHKRYPSLSYESFLRDDD